MHPVLESINSKPTSHKVGIWALTLVLPVAIFWQLLYKEKAKEVARLREEKEEIKSQILKESRLARDLRKVQRLVEELEGKLKVALTELPDEKEIPTLLTSISNLAQDAGLEVQLFKPGAENAREFFAEVPVSIQVAGSYHKVATFFDEVGRLTRVVNMGQLKMAKPEIKENDVSLTTNCVATTFRYLPEEERKEAQPANDKKGKRRK